MTKNHESGLKPWPELWKEILAYKVLDTTDCDLTPDESGWISIRCPLHDDENPSFRVNIESGGIHCFTGCKVGKNLNDLQALVMDKVPGEGGSGKPKDIIGDLAQRRLLPSDWLQKEFGIAIGNGGYLLPACDPLADPFIEADEIVNSTEDEIETIFSQREQHTQFKRGAWLGDDSSRPKYAWRPKFKKGADFGPKDLVYNLHRIKGKTVYITAGAPDCWVMWYAGFDAISFLGGESALPSGRAVSRIKAAGVQEAYVVYDNDRTGREGARDVAVELSKRGISAWVLYLPDDLGEKADITDLWKRVDGDIEKFEEILNNCQTKGWSADVKEEEERASPPVTIENLPADVWVEPFARYRSIMTRATDAPDDYHLFVLLTVIGSLIGRRAYVHFGKKLFPNLFCCLIGTTGITRKSTAINYGLQMGRDVDKKLHVTEGGGSAEGILERLAFADSDPADRKTIEGAMGWRGHAVDDQGNPLDEEWLESSTPHRRLLVHQDEFTNLLNKAKSGKSAGSTLIPTLLKSYDSPPDIRLPTRSKPLYIVNPVISMLAASTAEFLTRSFVEEDWHSGFGNRMIWCRKESDRVLVFPPQPDASEWDKIAGYIKDRVLGLKWQGKAALNKEGNEFKLSDDARAEWERIYLDWIENRDTSNPDHVAATQRVPEHAMKIALILAVMAPDDNEAHEIIDEDVEIAWEISKFAEHSAKSLVDQLVQEEEAARERIVIEWIKGKGSVKKEDIRHRFHRYGSATFNRMMNGMEEAGILEKNEAGRYIIVG